GLAQQGLATPQTRGQGQEGCAGAHLFDEERRRKPENRDSLHVRADLQLSAAVGSFYYLVAREDPLRFLDTARHGPFVFVEFVPTNRHGELLVLADRFDVLDYGGVVPADPWRALGDLGLCEGGVAVGDFQSPCRQLVLALHRRRLVQQTQLFVRRDALVYAQSLQG